jgi:N-acetylneuraminate synthase
MSFRSYLKAGAASVSATDPDCLVIGEVGLAHDGSLGLAHAFVDAIADAGADAVKFQTHIAEAESTQAEPWRVAFSTQDASRYDYWKRTAFAQEQWLELRRHADARGLLFVSSPFSVEAADLLEHVGVAAWKIPSGEASNAPLLRRVAGTGLPVILSTGMSPVSEIEAAVDIVRRAGATLAVLQCTSMYPCPPEKLGLALLPRLRERFACFVGLSDHSGTIFPGIAAVALGLDALEVHVTLSREMFGPDVRSSITTAELRSLVEGVRFVERALAAGGSKDDLAAETAHLRALFTKSLVARVDLEPGTTLAAEHVALKKPGTGLSSDRLAGLIGRRLARRLRTDEQLREDDFVAEAAANAVR